MRHIRLETREKLDDPRIQVLVDAALEQAEPSFHPTEPSRLIIKSISAKQRPRLPA